MLSATQSQSDSRDGGAVAGTTPAHAQASHGAPVVTGPPAGCPFTSLFGAPLPTTDDSLKAGDRGPMLLEDFHFVEKLQHFDRERIPERVVHARGTGMFGHFEPYGPDKSGGFDISAICRAAVFKPGTKTPVFLRLSTVQGSRGSPDNVRDVRGFATKFYTSEGIWDLVGNNIPVFFIQDGIKFPDLVHALKPEPNFEMPQAATAHDNFWDFISQMPEATHMVMWILSDRAVPRTLRTIQGFGVHTFVMQNERGDEVFVRLQWIPKQGLASNLWDEQQKCAGKDPDFSRRDMYDNISAGIYPEWEMGIQVIKPGDEDKFDFDILDSTKIWPESIIPVHKIGCMTLTNTPSEFFPQVEEAGFAPARVVPGITFSNDPLLQSRVFSYHDTQLHRLGPNFHLLPTNRSIAPASNHSRDGLMQFEVNPWNVNYHPHGINAGNGPIPKPVEKGGYSHSKQGSGGSAAAASSLPVSKLIKTHARPEKFADHYSQATLFWNSLAEHEKNHLVAAAWFELGKVTRKAVREKVVEQLNHVDHVLAERVAKGIGVSCPGKVAENHGKKTKGISMEEYLPTDLKGKKIAVLVAEGASLDQINEIKKWAGNEKVWCETVSATFGPIKSEEGKEIVPDKTFLLVSSTFYDAVVVPGGSEVHLDALKRDGLAVHFINETFKHCKPLAAFGNGIDLLAASSPPAIGLSNSASSTSAAEPSEESFATKISAGVSKVAQKAVSAMSEAVPQGMEQEAGVITSWGGAISKALGGLKASMLKQRIWKREDDPRVPA